MLAIAWVARAAAQGQLGLGRIQGRVTDSSRAVLPGVTLTLTGNGAATRTVLSNVDGSFAFDRVPVGIGYVLRANLQGFVPETEDVTVSANQTRVIDFELSLGCYGDLVVTGVVSSDLASLRRADAMLHVLVGDAGEDRHDGCGPTRAVVIIRSVPFTDAWQRLDATVGLLGARRFETGKEYLLFVNVFGHRHPRLSASFDRQVVRGQILGPASTDVEIRPGMSVDEALTRLGELRKQ